jgi:hypothetical protein
LIGLAGSLPVVQVPLDSLAEIDTNYWFHGSHEPTVRNVHLHARQALGVDRSFPVILGPDGRVMDGMHRILRALLEGDVVIDAVRFAELPPPDHVDVALGDELPH